MHKELWKWSAPDGTLLQSIQNSKTPKLIVLPLVLGISKQLLQLQSYFCELPKTNLDFSWHYSGSNQPGKHLTMTSALNLEYFPLKIKYYIQLDDGRNRLPNFQYLQTMKSLTRLERLRHLECCWSLKESCLPLHQLFTPFGWRFFRILGNFSFGVSYGIQLWTHQHSRTNLRLSSFPGEIRTNSSGFVQFFPRSKDSTDFTDFKEQRDNENPLVRISLKRLMFRAYRPASFEKYSVKICSCVNRMRL